MYIDLIIRSVFWNGGSICEEKSGRLSSARRIPFRREMDGWMDASSARRRIRTRLDGVTGGWSVGASCLSRLPQTRFRLSGRRSFPPCASDEIS